MKKILALAGIIFLLGSVSIAVPIIELAAPKSITTPVFSLDQPAKPQVKKNTKKNVSKNIKNKKKFTKKKVVAKKTKPIPFNYNSASKMIEYGYYPAADALLSKEIAQNPKNDKAIALSIISLAKQDKLDEAQNQIDSLIKKYPKNSDIHYAQGLVNYQRTNSSNMLYRNNTDVLLENAYKSFLQAIELDNKNAKAINAAGVIDLINGNFALAKKYFQLSYDADKTYANAIDNLGTIDLIENNTDAAEQKFKKALSLNPKNTLAMYHLAQLAIKKEDYQTALRCINNALVINPQSPHLLNLQGKIYYAQGNEAAAINSFKESISAKPEFLASYVDLAQIYNKRGDYEFAVAQLKTALAIQPDAYDVKIKIADISYANGKYSQAIDYYKSLTNIDNCKNDALKGLANAYFADAQNSASKSLIGSNSEVYKALDSINKAISLNGNDLELYLAKLKLTRLTNQPQKSRMILDNIVKSDGDNLIDYVVKGEAYLTLYDYKKADEMFDKAMKVSNNLTDDLYLAEILTYHKQFDTAIKVLDKIVTTSPGNQQALNDMDYIEKCKKYSINYAKSAQAFQKSRNKASAIEYYQKSLAINPNNPKARLELAKLYDKQKEFNDALNNYRAYVGLTQESRKTKKITKRIKVLENRLL